MKNTKVVFDYSTIVGKYDDFFMHLGYDEILSTLTPFGGRSLQLLKELVPKFKYVRIHNLFTSSTGDRKGIINAGCDPVKRTPEDALEFDFSLIDAVLDLIIEHGYTPYIEFGFMPRVLSKAPMGDKHAHTYPPERYDEWRLLIRSTVSHFCARYGDEAVKKSWYFELWNEPNTKTFWRGSIKDFCTLYDFTIAGLLDVFPDGQFRVGGPALSEMSYKFLRAFIEHCLYEKNKVTGQKGTKLDFLSFHVNGGWAFQTPSMKKIEKSILSYLGTIEYYMPQPEDRPGVPTLPRDLEIHIAELDPLVGCDISAVEMPKFRFRNTEYYAAFLSYTAVMIAYLRDLYKFKIPVVISDNLHFADEAGTFWKGCRCLTTAPFPSFNDKPKEISPISNEGLKIREIVVQPAVQAYQLMSYLYSDICALRSKPFKTRYKYNSLCTRSFLEPNKINLMISRFVPKYHHLPSLNLQHISVEIIELPIQYQKAEISEFFIDHQSPHTYNKWIAMGAPKFLDKTQYQKLKMEETIKAEKKYEIEITRSKLKISVDLLPHSVHLYQIVLK